MRDKSIINAVNVVICVIATIQLVTIFSNPEDTFLSAIGGWIIVIMSQLNILVLRNK